MREETKKIRAEKVEKETTADEKRHTHIYIYIDIDPGVNEAAYLSAVSVMCKQRPFRAARHTIALFAMQ